MNRVNLTYEHTARLEPTTLHDGNIVIKDEYSSKKNRQTVYLCEGDIIIVTDRSRPIENVYTVYKYPKVANTGILFDLRDQKKVNGSIPININIDITLLADLLGKDISEYRIRIYSPESYDIHLCLKGDAKYEN